MSCSSGKVSFLTRAVAKKTARTIKGLGGVRSAPIKGKLRVYLCPECGQWHMTSGERRHYHQQAIQGN